METKGIGQRLVTDSLVDKLQDRQSKVNSEASSPERGAEKADYQVKLSNNARELSQAQKRALDIAMKTDPIRADMVEKLKAKIRAGEYVIDSGRIADGMLNEAIKDRLSMEEDPS